MSDSLVRVEKDGHIATVTLNRPDSLNALSMDLMAELESIARSFVGDTDTRVVVFTGAGKHFSAGADLSDPKRAALAEAALIERHRRAQLGQRLIAALQAIPQITIAAINGGALGGGACIVSALDFRVAAEDAFVSYPEINLGMNLSWYGLPLCVRLVGAARAKRMVILGQKVPAHTLLDWGFVDEVLPPDQLLDSARTMAEQYASQPPMAAQMIKRSVNTISGAHDQAIMHMDTDQLLLAMSSQDFDEGVKAFREKRRPEFTGW